MKELHRLLRKKKKKNSDALLRRHSSLRKHMTSTKHLLCFIFRNRLMFQLNRLLILEWWEPCCCHLSLPRNNILFVCDLVVVKLACSRNPYFFSTSWWHNLVYIVMFFSEGWVFLGFMLIFILFFFSNLHQNLNPGRLTLQTSL